RQPAFLALAKDEVPARPASGDSVADAGADDPREADRPRGSRPSNLEKTFWPDDGYTKGDLLAYYEAIAPWMLPYLRDRPLVMTRFPDGITGPSFFQKDAPAGTPSWVRTVRVWSDESSREVQYIVADDVETLLWVANLASIPIHVW